MKDGGSDGISLYEYEKKGGDPTKYMQWKNDEAAQRYYKTSAGQLNELYLHPDSWHGRLRDMELFSVPPNLIYCLLSGLIGGVIGSLITLLLM